jgi:uncharacterized protein (TIGR03000 family)
MSRNHRSVELVINRHALIALLAATTCFISVRNAGAHGREGTAHSGGFAHPGPAGGVHSAIGGHHAPAFGVYHAPAVGPAVANHAPAFGGYGGSALGGYSGFEGGHAGLATDFGRGQVARAEGGRAYVAAGHRTTASSATMLAARGGAVRSGFHQYGAFNSAWWGAHATAWRPAGWGGASPWGWATWPCLSGWFGSQAAPIPYDYGNTIVYQNDQVIIDNQPAVAAALYYQQAANLALSAPENPPQIPDEQWQPLGVFTLVQGELTDAIAVFQLAVNKAGIIRGNYYNIFTNTDLPVRGAVDPKTQRASWIVGDLKEIVYDTGIVNLTMDQSPLLIHFGKARTQQWLLVRVKEPDANNPPPAPAVPSPTATDEAPAELTIILPSDADLFVDGIQTPGSDGVRTYSSPPLKPGVNYVYTIRARWTEEGKPVDHTRKIQVKAGTRVRVDFLAQFP